MIRRQFVTFILISLSLLGFAQNSKTDELMQQFQKEWELMGSKTPDEAEEVIDHSLKVIELYGNIYKVDSTLIGPQYLFDPYNMIAWSCYALGKNEEAIQYFNIAANIAVQYAPQLYQRGYTQDAVLSIFTTLRDLYKEKRDFENALALSKEIVAGYLQYNPQKAAYNQWGESQIYKLQDKADEVIKSDLKALDYMEQYGNNVEGFYAVTIAREILEGYLYTDDYHGALQFMDDNRQRLNAMIQGTEDAEFEELGKINKYLYKVYQHIGLHQKAANAALLYINHIEMTQGKQSADYAIWMNNIACSYMDMYRNEHNAAYLNKADSLFNIANNIWLGIPDHQQIVDYATFLGNYGNLLSAQKEYTKAEASLLKSLQLYQQLNCTDDYLLVAKSRLATLYGDSGAIEKSISLQKELLSQYEQRGDTLQAARVCNILSQLFWIEYDNSEMGEQYANKAYELLHEAGITNALTATVTMNLSRIYYNIGLDERALKYALEAQQIKSSLGIDDSPFDLLNIREFMIDNYSNYIYSNPMDFSKGISDTESFCRYIIKNNSGDSRDEKILRWKAKTVLAKACMFTHRFDEAESIFKEQLTIEEELWGKNSENHLVTLNQMAYCNYLKGDYKSCLHYSLECVNHTPNHKNYENIVSSSLALGDLSTVEKYMKPMFDTSLDYMRQQFLYMGMNQREELIERGQMFGFHNFTLPASVYPKSEVCAQYAYNSALIYKGLLLSTEKDVEATLAAIPDETLKNDYKDLKRMQSKLQMTKDSVDVASLKREIELKEKNVMRSLREHSDFTKSLDVVWSDVQKHLQDGDLAVEFVEIDNSLLPISDSLEYYGALVLKKNWKAPKFVLLHNKLSVDSLIKVMITDFSEAEDKAYTNEQWNQINRQLYSMIWEPLAPYLAPEEHVYFSPVGMLALLPMEILRDEDGRYINDKYELYRMSSTKGLCLPQEPTITNNVVLYGGLIYEKDGKQTPASSLPAAKREGWQYLPSTAKEVAVMDSLLRNRHIRTQVYDKNKGTEESFKNLSGKPISILHLATHGFYFNEEESNTYDFFNDMNIQAERGTGVSTLLRSGLMMAGGQQAWLHGSKDLPQDKDDGILLAAEISLLDLRDIDMVTMSACQTGLGDISDDGVMGLQRGFKRAGVNTLLMTLWPVNDDATQILMREFYRNLTEDKSKRQSLKLAQQFLRENHQQYNNPYYWAPFILLDALF